MKTRIVLAGLLATCGPAVQAQSVPEDLGRMADEVFAYMQCAVWAEYADVQEEDSRLFDRGYVLLLEYVLPFINGSVSNEVWLASTVDASVAIGVGLRGPIAESPSVEFAAGRVYQTIRNRTFSTLMEEDGTLPLDSDVYVVRAQALYREHECAALGRE